MDFNPTYTLKSKVCPGVEVTLRRVGPILRGAVEMSIAGPRAKQRDISVRFEDARVKMDAAIAASPRDPEGKPIEEQLRPEAIVFALEIQGAEAELESLVQSQINPAFVKAAVISFGGEEPLTYNGNPATAELLCEFGPEALFNEVVAAVNNNGYLPTEAARNLQSPTTSGAPVAGEQTNSTAPLANPDASTSVETASPDTPGT